MSDIEERSFRNNLKDFPSDKEESVVQRDGTLNIEFQSSSRSVADKYFSEWRTKTRTDHDRGYSGESVYTGLGGAALLHYFVHSKSKDPAELRNCLEVVEKQVGRLKFKYPSFLCGDAGLLAIGAAARCRNGEPDKARAYHHEMIKKLSGMVLDTNSGIPDEVLYGRAGFLYALLFVQRECSPEVTVDEKLIRDVCSAILDSGERFSRNVRFPAPLYYEWHDKAYLGAAHGFCGILFLLLSAKVYLREEDVRKVRATIDHLMSLRFASGNFPSSLGSRSDKLVHWCHGAPGFVFLMAKSFEVFRDPRYLEVTRDAADIVWKYGLLKKGFGLCHGVAGNAYALLYAYQVLRDERFLHRAAEFARFCEQRGRIRVNTPDRPLSMFEGLAGTAYFLIDFQDFEKAKFPGFVV